MFFIFFILFVEIINMVIEVIIDRIGIEFYVLLGLVKDLVLVGVFLFIVIVCVLWVGVFYSYI